MKTKTISTTAIAIALLTIGAWIKLPVLIIPVSMQTFVVFFNALVFRKEESQLAIIIYILMGLLGLPVFTSGGGLQYVLQPTFGYLIGFVGATFMVSHVNHKSTVLKKMIISVSAQGLIYGCGILYFIFLQHYFLNTSYSLGWMMISLAGIFVGKDVISLIFAILVSQRFHIK